MDFQRIKISFFITFFMVYTLNAQEFNVVSPNTNINVDLEITNKSCFKINFKGKKIIDEIEDNGGILTGFESFTGGLVAPESDDNPWNYKFTWNPRNVILAGQGTSKYLESNEIRKINYDSLCEEIETIEQFRKK